MFDGRNNAEGYAYNKAENKCTETEFNRSRKTLDKQTGNGHTKAERPAKIAVGDLVQVNSKLNVYGFIQSVLMDETVTYSLSSFFTQNGPTWVTGNHPCQDERDQQDTKKNRYG